MTAKPEPNRWNRVPRTRFLSEHIHDERAGGARQAAHPLSSDPEREDAEGIAGRKQLTRATHHDTIGSTRDSPRRTSDSKATSPEPLHILRPFQHSDPALRSYASCVLRGLLPFVGRFSGCSGAPAMRSSQL